MKGLFIRINDDLDQRLAKVCKKEGYKKVGLVTKLLSDFLQRHSEGQNPITEAQEFGIDTTLLAQNLQKTPTERLRDHAQFEAFVQEARKAGIKKDERSLQSTSRKTHHGRN